MIAIQVPCSPRLKYRSRLHHRGQSYYQVTIHSSSFRLMGYQIVHGMYTGVTSTQQTQEKATFPGHHRIAQDRLTAVNCTVVDLDKLFDLKVRINSFFASIPEQCCKVCYILGERTTSACGAVCKIFSGVFLCPQ